MIRNEVAFGIGVTVGLLAVGAMAFYIYIKKNKNINKEKKMAENFSEKLKRKEYYTKNLDDLLSTQTYVEVLTTNELTSWFKENKILLSDKIKMIISIPTKEVLDGLGYLLTESIDPKNNLIQFFYDEDKREIMKIRLINYSDIESNLQAHLIEENGLIVITS